MCCVAGVDQRLRVDEVHQSAGGVPGQFGIHTNMTNTKNTPIEALERAFPMRVLRQRLRRGSGGAGSAPGGEGIERDLQVLVDATVSLITERRISQPWGLAGGEPGAVGENWFLPGGDESRAERLPDKCTIQLKPGDGLRMLTPGGGGWGAADSADSQRAVGVAHLSAIVPLRRLVSCDGLWASQLRRVGCPESPGGTWARVSSGSMGSGSGYRGVAPYRRR